MPEKSSPKSLQDLKQEGRTLTQLRWTMGGVDQLDPTVSEEEKQEGRARLVAEVRAHRAQKKADEERQLREILQGPKETSV
jgi:hypothetical protein